MNYLETDEESNPWVNIQLSESGVIRSVALFTGVGNANKLSNTSI
jgi:hypothetical protein